MKRSPVEKTILVLALLGVLLGLYAVPLHYKNGGSMCDINAKFNCDTVNKSQWSTLFGIPVAILGLLAYLVLTLLVIKRKSFAYALGFTDKDYWQYVFVFVCVMLVFQLYLTYVEFFLIGSYCIVCLTSQALLLVLTPSIWKVWQRAN